MIKGPEDTAVVSSCCKYSESEEQAILKKPRRMNTASFTKLEVIFLI